MSAIRTQATCVILILVLVITKRSHIFPFVSFNHRIERVFKGVVFSKLICMYVIRISPCVSKVYGFSTDKSYWCIHTFLIAFDFFTRFSISNNLFVGASFTGSFIIPFL